MTAEPTYAPGGPPRLVGQVFTNLVIRNYRDVIAAEERGNGHRVREESLERVLVDTGATHLCLPTDIIERLGLVLRREIVVRTAAGERETRLYGAAEVTIDNRTTLVNVIELPGAAQPLLGVLPMEELGIEPDLANQKLRMLPETGPSSHFTAYSN
jgi:clan AA aspartic protease